MSEVHRLSLAEAGQKLHNGELSAEQVTSACLEQLEKTEGQINALLLICADEALKQAQEMDKEGVQKDKALWGIPITIKDAIVTKGMETTAGSKILKNFIPYYDAHVVEALKNSGAIILAKNNMDEFAMGSSTENSAYGITRNPWDLDRVPGGSSGGSAASVVAGQCYASLGSDTGGSIRQPASLCGCVGLKPTYGRVSRYGLIAYGSSLDQIGPLARSVEDCAIMLQAIAGHDERDSTSAPREVENYALALNSRNDLKNVRIGIPSEFFAEGLDAEVNEACQNVLSMAKDLGAEIVELSLPHTYASIAAYYIIAMAEASSNLARFDGVRYGHRSKEIENLAELYLNSRTEGFGEEVQRRIMLGTYVLSSGYYDAYYKKAAQVRRLIQEDYTNALQKCDVLCAPVSPVPAWKIGSLTSDPLQMYLMDIYTLSLNLAGMPGLSIPIGLGSDSKLPIGMQFFTNYFEEGLLLSIGNVLEKNINFKQHPEMF